MKTTYPYLAIAVLAFTSMRSYAQPILSDPALLKKAGIPVLRQDTDLGVAYSEVTPAQLRKLSLAAHELGRCGGYEALVNRSPLAALGDDLNGLRTRKAIDSRWALSTKKSFGFEKRAEVELAVSQVREADLETHVKWLSSFPTRYHASATPNAHVEALKTRLEEILKGSKTPVTLEFVTHQRTKQKTLKARIAGTTRAAETIVLGAHLDSTAFGPTAPGADDDASGSANLIEIVRILAQQPAPARTIDIFWYAAEEVGLYGSAEIAKDYRTRNVDVVAAMQLDMTLHPGAGEFVLGMITDFTSVWLNGVIKELNTLYVGSPVAESKCGYGCSDHASWTRNAYASTFPFEATFATHNKNIHTTSDVVDAKSSFKHSAIFSKLGVAFAMEMGNSTLREK